MVFADLLEQVGSTGRFQVVHTTLLCLPILMMASQNILQNFVAAVPPHFCSAHTNLSASTRMSAAEKLHITVPIDANGSPEKCRRYESPQWHLLANNGSTDPEVWEDSEQAALRGCDDGWTYDERERSSSIISEWHLVCSLRSLKSMGQTVYMGGVLVGAGVFGALADRFGRRVLLTMSYLLMAVSGTCAAFSPSFSLFCLFRFMCGMALSGVVLNSFSLIVEWIPTRVRTVVGTGTGYCYTMGQLILALVAYFIRDWRWLTFAVSLPFYVAFLYSWWLLESSRWLVLKNKPEQAVENLRLVARYNGRQADGEKIDVEMVKSSMKKEMSGCKSSYTTLDLFRTPTMRKMTVCLCAVWFSTSFAYYGLSMDLQKFGVDIYLIQVIFGAADIPAKVIINITMSYCGRRLSQCGGLVLAGITILSNLLVPHDKQMLRTCLAVLGKGCLAASFNCCYLYSGELYPTILRQSGLGWVSMMARLGAMVAPLVLLLGEYVTWLPGLIYGLVPVLSGVAAFLLPETLNIPLPDTIQDVEDRGTGRISKTEKKEAIFLQDNADNLLKQTS
ncbi:solute carrier family 22 member 6-like [Gadus macrocephalus]|uniref:solute carrier family 22 member 6-like n=1 Tax=Gadus macrocephalus TaxID=80720 RepID=UPI0028CB41FF|nr:solute carrier family 22 member 6-like [Gadus macrocephalus]XP_059912662.1 solute carrier family 22 member 6-like [Gadus macrocephalus]